MNLTQPPPTFLLDVIKYPVFLGGVPFGSPTSICGFVCVCLCVCYPNFLVTTQPFQVGFKWYKKQSLSTQLVQLN